MNYKDILIDFLITKNIIISINLPHSSKVRYLIGKDLTEIEESWDEKTCYKCLKKLSLRGDGIFCPWCITNRGMECSDCGYGERHGICLCNYESSYHRIIKILRTHIIKLEGMEHLYYKTKLKFYFARIFNFVTLKRFR